MRRYTLVALATTLALSGPVHAVTAAAEVRNLTFQLVDLDPNDGVTPEVRIAGAWTRIYVNTSDSALEWSGGPAGGTGGEEYTDYPPVPDYVRDDQHGMTRATLLVNQSTMATFASSTSTWGYAQSSAGLYNDTGGGVDLWITRQTRLTVSGELFASISGEGGCGVTPLGDASCTAAIANAYIATTAPGQSFRLYFRSTPGTVFDSSMTLPFSFTTERTNADYDITQITMGALAYANTISPVPEPSGWLLALSAIGCVFIFRRRLALQAGSR